MPDAPKLSRMAQLKDRARQLKRETYALIYAYQDPRTPWYARLFAAFIVARTFSPIDLIPDFIPVLGALDDLILTPLYIGWALKMIPAGVMADARARADAELQQSKPVNWVYAGLVIAIWALLIYLVIRAVSGAFWGS